MLKVLVVDDELIHRRGLAAMIREIRPSYEVFEAKNGKEALDIIISSSMDIIITDVKMPIMDGLRFMEEAHHLLQKAKIIILSGYRNFDYAQKALSFGACEYLVKPIRQSDIVKMLEKIESSIELEAIKDQQNENLIKKLDSTLPVYFEHLMNSWISGNVTEAELNEIKQVFACKSPGIVIVVNIKKYESFTKNFANQEIIDLRYNMKYTVKKSFDHIGHSISFFLEDSKNTMVTILTLDNASPLSITSYTRGFYQFIDTLRDSYEIDAVINVGTLCEDIFCQAKISFDKAFSASFFNFYHQAKKVIFYSDIANNFQNKCPDFSKSEETLKEAVRHLKRETVKNNVDYIFNKATENGYYIPSQFIKAIIHMTLNIVSIIRDFVDDVYYNELLLDIEQQLSKCEACQDLKNSLFEIFELFSNIIENTKTRKHELILEKCVQYLDIHFMEDISLESVSDAFYFSPSYFSLVFKNHTGMPFSKYLSQLRLRKAVELLDKSSYKVYEIASKIGYKDDKYFYRVFKKEYGVTPDEYRRVL